MSTVWLRHPIRALRALPTSLPHLDGVPTIRHLPGVKVIARGSRQIKRLVPASDGGTVAPGVDLVAPRTPFQIAVSAHRRVAFGSLPFDDVKTVKKAFGCTVNDVVMALCAAGLRSWLDERGELPTEPLLGVIPVSVRTREQMGTFGNQVSAMTVELPTNEADPGQRLRLVSETMVAAKERHRELPVSLMQDVNTVIPPVLFSHAVRAMSQVAGLPGIDQPVNLMISNVPGPSAPVYLAGARQRAQFPIAGVKDGIGLNITVFSYEDSLEIGIVVDREQVDDPWPILSALRAGLRELRDLADVRPLNTHRKQRVARSPHGPSVR